MYQKRAALLVLVLSMPLVGCQQDHRNPVVVTVNGVRINKAEIDAEMQAMPSPPGIDQLALRNLATQRVIDRKLLASAAQERSLDKRADFLVQKQRVDELLLDRFFAEQLLATIPTPTEAQLNKQIMDHANIYEGREQLILDQVRFPTPKDPGVVGLFARDHSLSAVISRLKAMGINYQRTMVGLDTASLPPQVLEQINKVPMTEPFMLPQAGAMTVSVVTDRNKIGADPRAMRQSAIGAWRQQALARLIDTKLSVLKADAKIRFETNMAQ